MFIIDPRIVLYLCFIFCKLFDIPRVSNCFLPMCLNFSVLIDGFLNDHSQNWMCQMTYQMTFLPASSCSKQTCCSLDKCADVALGLAVIILKIPFGFHLCLILSPGFYVFLFFGLLTPSFSWISFSNSFLRKSTGEKILLRLSSLNISLPLHLIDNLAGYRI